MHNEETTQAGSPATKNRLAIFELDAQPLSPRFPWRHSFQQATANNEDLCIYLLLTNHESISGPIAPPSKSLRALLEAKTGLEAAVATIGLWNGVKSLGEDDQRSAIGEFLHLLGLSPALAVVGLRALYCNSESMQRGDFLQVVEFARLNWQRETLRRAALRVLAITGKPSELNDLVRLSRNHPDPETAKFEDDLLDNVEETA